MFGFGKNNGLKKLEKRYQKLMEESYKLSHSDRRKADLKQAEANEVLLKIEELKKVSD